MGAYEDDEHRYYDEVEDDEEYETFDGELIRETDKANLFKIKRGEFWCPKSAGFIEDGVVHIADWFDIKFLPKRPDYSDEFGAVE